jgi:hypothetical protein
MSRIRVLVGTKKGAFVLTSGGKRERGTVPLFVEYVRHEWLHGQGDPPGQGHGQDGRQ